MATAALMAGLAGLVACGGGGNGGGAVGGDGPASGDYFPLQVGNHWTYRVASGELYKAQVTGTTATPLGSAAVVTVGTPGSASRAEQHYVVAADRVIQVPTSQDDPLTQAMGPVPLMRLPPTAGDGFTQASVTVDSGVDFDGDGRTDLLTLSAEVSVVGFETVAVAAGTFPSCAHLRTVNVLTVTASSNGAQLSATSTVDDWYAPDVGPVRSVMTLRSGSITETARIDLVAYHVNGRRNELVSPAIIAISPSPGSTSRGSDGVRIDFTEPIDPDSAAPPMLALLDPSGSSVAVTVNVVGNSVSMLPATPLLNGTHRLRLDGLTDLAGNRLPTQTWAFTVDATGPAVVSVSPSADARDVPLDATIRIEFSEAIDPATLAHSIALFDSAGNAAFDVSLSGNVVTLAPLVPLRRGSQYTVSVGGLLTDRAGNAVTPYSWRFYTDPGLLSWPVGLTLGSAPGAAAIGDVNGDGRADVVMTTTYYFDPANDFKLFVFLQRSDGTLAPPVKLDTAAVYGCFAESIVIADIDGDGRNDVILGESGCGIEIFRQAADGTLRSTGVIATPESYKLRAIDLDGDGRADLVSMGWGTGQVAVWRQLANGTLSAPLLVPIEHFGWGDLDVGDINGDGRPDIVVTSGQGDHSKSLAWVLQLPGGGFDSAQYREVDPVWGAWGVAIGDIDGDGRNDIVTSWGGNSPTHLGVFRQRSDGTMPPTQTLLPTYDMPGAIEIVDMNNDGRKDIVVIHRGWNALSVYLQRADGTLAPREQFPAPYVNHNPQLMAVGDFNGDGYADVAIAGLAVVYNRTPLTGAAAAPPSSVEVPLLHQLLPRRRGLGAAGTSSAGAAR